MAAGLIWDYTGNVKIGDSTQSVHVFQGSAMDMDLSDRYYYVDVSDVLSNISSGSSGPSGPSSGSTSPAFDTTDPASNGINTDGSTYLNIPMTAWILYQGQELDDYDTTYLNYNDINISYYGFTSIKSVTAYANNIIVSINNIYSEELYDNIYNEDTSYYLSVTGRFTDDSSVSKSINVDNSRIYFTNPPQLNLNCSSEFVTDNTSVVYDGILTIKFSISGISSTQLQNFCNVSVTSNNNYVTIGQRYFSDTGNNCTVSIRITGNNTSSTSKDSLICLSITPKSKHIKLNNGSNLTDSVYITSQCRLNYLNALIDVNKTSITINKIQNIELSSPLIKLLSDTDDIIVYFYTGTSLSTPYEDNCFARHSFGESWLNCTVTSNNPNIVAIESSEVTSGFYEYCLIVKSPGTTSIKLQTTSQTLNNYVYQATSKTITVTVTEQSLNPVSSGKIATINDINTKFNITLSTDEQNLNLCVSYSMIKDIAVIAPLTSNTHYSSNQLVILDAIVNIPQSNDGFEVVLPNITIPTASPSPTPSSSPTPSPIPGGD